MHGIEAIKKMNKTGRADVYARAHYEKFLAHRRNLVTLAEGGNEVAQFELMNGPVVYNPPGHPNRTY